MRIQTVRIACCWAVLLALGVTSAAGATSALGFEAMRTDEPPRIDGRLDEAGWRAAPVFSAFHQSFPDPAAPPSERTEVRVLYDDSNLYVGIRCFDSQPRAINAQLGPRDSIPASDRVRVMIDSLRDRRTGTSLSLNAGGTREDARIYQENVVDRSWDGDWEGVSSRDEQGWSAELLIPLRLLDFSAAPEQRWGFHVRRELARTHETLDSVPLPPEVNALVSRFAELRSLRNLKPPRALTLVPYVTTRLVRRPVPELDSPRLLEPSADVGLDAQLRLTNDLSLVATANPDFGQVETDALFVNLSRVELFFPEKRPFFVEGLELFEPVVSIDNSEQFFFYSRRIGLELPLLAAVKLNGSVHERVRIGVLDGLVAGVPNPHPESLPPDRGVSFHPWRPLHLAPNFSLPDQVPPPTNFLASVVRVQVGEGATLGALTTLATPLLPECHGGIRSPEEEQEEEGCRPRGGRAVALDAQLRSPSGDYELAAQVAGSQVTGGPALGEVLSDGTPLHSGDTGLGLQLSGGKLGGEPWLLGVTYSHASPRLELNPTGFQRINNEQLLVLTPRYFRTGWRGLPEAEMGLRATARWSADSRAVPLGNLLALTGRAVLPNLAEGNCEVGVRVGRKDLREIEQTGVLFQRPSVSFLDCDASTDPNRPLSLSAFMSLNHLLDVPTASERNGVELELDTTWQPVPRLQTLLGVRYDELVDGPRWLPPQSEGDHLVFGDLKPRFLTLTFSQLLVLSPAFTLRAQAQLLSGYGRYTHFYEARAEPGDFLRLTDLSPTTLDEDPSYNLAQLNLNVVLRWDYRLGSTFFIVYTRTQEALPTPGEPVRYTLQPVSLLAGPHSDSLQVKLGFRL